MTPALRFPALLLAVSVLALCAPGCDDDAPRSSSDANRDAALDFEVVAVDVSSSDHDGTVLPDSRDDLGSDSMTSDTDEDAWTEDTDPNPALATTELTDHLVLRSRVPALVAACAPDALPGVPCDDVDVDGLVDAWEDLVLDRMRPLLRFDEEESLLKDSESVVADVGRVFPVSTEPLVVRAFIMLGYARDYGSCLTLSGHNGDSERVALELVGFDGGGPGDVAVARLYTAAHESTIADQSQRFAGNDATLRYALDPATAEPRWLVFPSANKHATYATVEICEGIAPGVPCVDEDCAPDGVSDPERFDLLPPVYNAGEEAHPRLTDLGPIGFPGDDAWADQDFCGGRTRSNCSSAVRIKLTEDPFL